MTKRYLKYLFKFLYTLIYQTLKFFKFKIIVLNYYNPPFRKKNFGDYFNIFLLSKYGYMVVNSEYLLNYNGDIYSIVGSVLDKIESKKNNFIIFGSGLMYESSSCKANIKKVYYCRGNLSKKIIIRDNPHLIKSRIKIGDPGLLISKLFKVSKLSKKYKFGIIPHHFELPNVQKFKKIISANDGVIISPNLPPKKVAYLINKCEFIFSSSLHGLVFSDSYNVPNLWSHFSVTNKQLDTFKFEDYYSSINRISTPFSFDLNKIQNSLKIIYQESHKKRFNKINNIITEMKDDFLLFIYTL